MTHTGEVVTALLFYFMIMGVGTAAIGSSWALGRFAEKGYHRLQ